MCSLRGGDFRNQFSVLAIANTWLSCLMQEFFNSDHATADKVDLKSENSLKEEKVAIKNFSINKLLGSY